jgi:hypothetical protein
MRPNLRSSTRPSAPPESLRPRQLCTIHAPPPQEGAEAAADSGKSFTRSVKEGVVGAAETVSDT